MKSYRITTGRRALAAAAAAAIVLSAAAAMAQGPGPGPQGGPGLCDNPQPGARMAARLGLDQQQQEAVQKIRLEGRERDLPLRKQIMRLRNELHGEMLKDSPSEGAVLDLSAKISQVQKDLHANRLKDQLAIRKLLTPEQRDRMLLMDGHGRHGGRPDRDGAGRCGGRHERPGRGGFGPACPGFGGGPALDLDDEQPEPDQD